MAAQPFAGESEPGIWLSVLGLHYCCLSAVCLSGGLITHVHIEPVTQCNLVSGIALHEAASLYCCCPALLAHLHGCNLLKAGASVVALGWLLRHIWLPALAGSSMHDH